MQMLRLFFGLSVFLFLTGFLFETDEACEKVDFLFVIDNSGSMNRYQQNLIKNYPDFIQKIQTDCSANDYHVGVISTDKYPKNPSKCQKLGALVQHGKEKACFKEGSKKSYLTNKDDLEKGFQCLADVGTNGDGFERPLGAIAAALRNEHGCNNGFLRDDALLVITLITDEDARENNEYLQTLLDKFGLAAEANTPMSEWQQAVLQAKGGQPNRVVVLSLLDPNDSTKLTEFTRLFPNGYVNDIATDSYGSFFQLAVGNIETACKNIFSTCPANQCCWAPSLIAKLLMWGLPLLAFLFSGWKLSGFMAVNAAKAGKSIPAGYHSGWSFGGFIGLLILGGLLVAFSKNCVPQPGWIILGVLTLSNLIYYAVHQRK